MRSRALRIICIAVALDAVGGVVFAALEHLSIANGLYWAIATATTVGYGDVVPHTVGGHVVAVVVMMTVIPLFAAAFSLVTSTLTAAHVGAPLKLRLDHIIFHHPDIPPLKDEVTASDGS